MTDQTAADLDLAELMEAAQKGDEVAYLALLRTITPRVRRIVAHRRRFAARTDVEDLVQEILLSLHAVRSTYDARRPFMPWLLAIIRHRLADAARRHARTTALELPVELDVVTFPDTSTKHSTGAAADALALRQAISGLPRGQRHAIELLKLQGFSLKEAAAATGSTVGSLKIATHRALAALRVVLGGKRPL